MKKINLLGIIIIIILIIIIFSDRNKKEILTTLDYASIKDPYEYPYIINNINLIKKL